MSSMAKDARKASKSKAERLVRADPKAKVDASGYTPEGALDADVQTGPRPISRRQFKRGGSVDGRVKPHAGRKPRKSGGMTASDFVNRDVREANKDREGIKHDGGFKRGGRTGKAMGGAMPMRPPVSMNPATPAPVASTPSSNARPMPRPMLMRKSGGKVHSDEKQDRALIKDVLHEKGCDCKKCSGGRVGRAEGGKVNLGTRPQGGRIPRASGGRAKKGTNINIIIAPSGGAGAGAPKPPMPMPPPGPGGLHQAAPPPPPMAPPGAGAPMQPQMARKHGGRTNYPIDTGGGGGLARLAKIKAYG